MRTKLIFLFILAWAGLVGVVYWHVDHKMAAERMRLHEAQMKTQISSLSLSMKREIEIINDLMSSEMERAAGSGANVNLSASSSQRLEMVAKFEAGKIETAIFREQDQSGVKPWAQAYLTLMLNQNTEKLSSGEIQIFPVLDPNKSPWFYIVADYDSSKDGKKLVGLVPAALVQNSVDNIVGQIDHLMVINDQGVVLSHLESQYITSQIAEDDPVIAEIKKDRPARGDGVFLNSQNEKNKVVYENLEGSNAWIVSIIPVDIILAPIVKLKNQILVFATGIGLLILAGLFFFSPVQTETETAVRQSPPESEPIIQKAFVSTPPSSPTPVISEKMASAISEELQGPMNSILAQVKLAKSKAQNKEELGHLERIETQAQQSREMILKIRSMAQVPLLNLQPGYLRQAIEQALIFIEEKIKSEQIAILKEYKEVPKVLISQGDLSRAMVAVFENSIEALKNKMDKQIRISVFSSESGVALEITDNGQGMAEDEIQRATEAFYSGFKTEGHLGLGLSLVSSIVSASHGEMKIFSKPNDGTTLHFDFPVATQELQTQLAEVASSSANQTAHVPLAPLPSYEVSQPQPSKPSDSDLIIEDDVVKIPSVFSNEAIEETLSMIDNIDELPEEQAVPKPVQSIEVEPLVVQAEAPPLANMGFKIDRPEFDFVNKKTELDNFEVKIRKPEFKSGDPV
jgi:signal transduction histidine kinase